MHMKNIWKTQKRISARALPAKPETIKSPFPGHLFKTALQFHFHLVLKYVFLLYLIYKMHTKWIFSNELPSRKLFLHLTGFQISFLWVYLWIPICFGGILTIKLPCEKAFATLILLLGIFSSIKAGSVVVWRSSFENNLSISNLLCDKPEI